MTTNSIGTSLFFFGGHVSKKEEDEMNMRRCGLTQQEKMFSVEIEWDPAGIKRRQNPARALLSRPRTPSLYEENGRRRLA